MPARDFPSRGCCYTCRLPFTRMRLWSQSSVLFVIIFLGRLVLSTREPEFAEPAQNVTVIKGRDAELPCVINHLGKYHVAWVKVDTQTILSIHTNVITRNYRINLKHSEHRYWYLHIADVRESDQGFYMCQINTVPMKSLIIFLNVSVSPNILDNETSSDVIVTEGVNLTLTCRASGYPPPIITWQREDAAEFSLSPTKKVNVSKGEDLTIVRVNRLHMGAYLCIASNHIPPAVSKRISLQVHFNPMIWVPNQLVGGITGGEVTLECVTEAFPKSINYWINERGDMVTSNDKYLTVFTETKYQVIMKLRIKDLELEDYGQFTCFAKNSLGETDGTIRLYEIERPTETYLTTTDRINFRSKGHLGENRLQPEENMRAELIESSDRYNISGRHFDSSLEPPQIDNIISIRQRPPAEIVNGIGVEHRAVLFLVMVFSFVLPLIM